MEERTVSLTSGKRILFLTKDLGLIRRQLAGEIDLTIDDVRPEDLLDDINTDVMTPAWVCFRHRPEDLALDAYAGLVHAQQIWVGGGYYGRFAPRFAAVEDFDGRFLYCRAYFQVGWSTDYPGADNNFSVRLAELTKVLVKFDENRQPHHVVVRLDDPDLERGGAEESVFTRVGASVNNMEVK